MSKEPKRGGIVHMRMYCFKKYQGPKLELTAMETKSNEFFTRNTVKLSIYKLAQRKYYYIPSSYVLCKQKFVKRVSLLPDTLQKTYKPITGRKQIIKMTKAATKVPRPLKLNCALKCHGILPECQSSTLRLTHKITSYKRLFPND